MVLPVLVLTMSCLTCPNSWQKASGRHRLMLSFLETLATITGWPRIHWPEKPYGFAKWFYMDSIINSFHNVDNDKGDNLIFVLVITCA